MEVAAVVASITGIVIGLKKRKQKSAQMKTECE